MRFSGFFFLASFFVDQAYGHGAMQFPQSRNVYKTHYCPQCANGSGVCGAGGSSQWPADSSASIQLNGEYTTDLTELVAGGMVEVEVYLTAAHQGHFALELCANPSSKITDDCFVRLERDPSDTRYSPYASSAPWAAIFPENSCATTFTPSAPMKVRFIVPSGSVSDHAILRWYWQSGNSCDSLSETSKDAPSAVKSWSATINGKSCSAAISQSGHLCGDECPNSSCSNEQFKNCADVKIVSGDSSVIVTSSGKEGSDSPSGGSSSGGSSSGGSSSGGSSSGGNNSHHDDDDSDDDDSHDSDSDDGDSHDGDSHDDDDDDDDDNSHNGASNGGNSTGEDWTGDVKKCKKDVEGRKSGWDDLCESFCEEIAVSGSPQQLWCMENGYTSLSKCVYKFYKTVCEDD